MSETNPIGNGNGGAPAAQVPQAGQVPQARQAPQAGQAAQVPQAAHAGQAPQAAQASQSDKFTVNVAGGTSQEAKKTTAVSFLQNLISNQKAEAGKGGVQTGGTGISPAKAAPTEGNLFTKLFPANAPSSPLPQAPGMPKFPMVNLPKLTLGKAPAFDEVLEQKKVSRAKTLFFVVLLLTGVALGLLFLQLKPDVDLFGKTIAKKFDETNQAVIAKQTQMNEVRFRLAVFHLTRVNILSDAYQFYRAAASSPSATSASQSQARLKAASQRDEMKTSLTFIKKALEPRISIALFSKTELSAADLDKQFEDALRENLQAAKGAAKDPQEIHTLNSVTDLLNNRAFRGFLRNMKVDALDDAAVENIMKEIRKQGTDPLSQIHQLKASRIQWTEIIDRIDQLTRQVDKVYGQGLFNEIGGIRFTNYDFNAATGQISLTGQVKTDDSKTFTLLADIVDTFEKSPYFKGIEMRDFTKSKGEGGFTSSLRLQFFLENPEEIKQTSV